VSQLSKKRHWRLRRCIDIVPKGSPKLRDKSAGLFHVYTHSVLGSFNSSQTTGLRVVPKGELSTAVEPRLRGQCVGLLPERTHYHLVLDVDDDAAGPLGNGMR